MEDGDEELEEREEVEVDGFEGVDEEGGERGWRWTG